MRYICMIWYNWILQPPVVTHQQGRIHRKHQRPIPIARMGPATSVSSPDVAPRGVPSQPLQLRWWWFWPRHWRCGAYIMGLHGIQWGEHRIGPQKMRGPSGGAGGTIMDERENHWGMMFVTTFWVVLMCFRKASKLKLDFKELHQQIDSMD